jgi:hypothetical protein
MVPTQIRRQGTFRLRRAAAVAESLVRYKNIIARCLQPLLLHALNSFESDVNPEVIVLSVHEPSTEGPSLHLLHWELLEDKQLRKGITIPVLFPRKVSTPAVLRPRTKIRCTSNYADVTNILLVSARPGGRDDLPYRFISQPQWDLVHSDKELLSRIKIHFVRPGTWSAFRNVLLNQDLDYGFISIVHFDTHGMVDKQGR